METLTPRLEDYFTPEEIGVLLEIRRTYANANIDTTEFEKPGSNILAIKTMRQVVDMLLVRGKSLESLPVLQEAAEGFDYLVAQGVDFSSELTARLYGLRQ